ncbi:unnamed protein product [Paramecium octaurelia]|uniref:Uncharacterized protein n=1 Tax=Paramecium octaurelia TaxID=43137 RepID=A0A8S1WKK1_PAROT|nr:unnamed protein product [Paramecium octaurelia]
MAASTYLFLQLEKQNTQQTIKLLLNSIKFLECSTKLFEKMQRGKVYIIHIHSSIILQPKISETPKAQKLSLNGRIN